MKKFLFTLMFAMVALFAHAQQTTVEGSKLFDNTSVSVYGGALGWFDPAVANEAEFLDGVRPTFGVELGKWFTPVVGLNVTYDGTLGSLPFDAVRDRYTVFDMSNLGLNAQFNVNNMFHRYKGRPDLVEVVPFAGLGWLHGWSSLPGSNFSAEEWMVGDHTANFLTADAGAKINFNMGKQRAWQINLKPAVTWVLTGEGSPLQMNADHAYVSVQAGVTYKFGHKNSQGERVHDFTSAYTAAEYTALLTALNEKPKEVEKVVEKVITNEVTVETVKTVSLLPVPHFNKGKYDLDVTTLATLDVVAADMKSNDLHYTLTGYASVEGEESFNQELSLNRADAVRDALIRRGVDGNRLTSVAGGVTDKFGDVYEQNRLVVIEQK